LNARIERITQEIEKLKRKIPEYQGRLRELERQKTELENADIVALVRGVDIPPEQLADFVRMFQEQKNTAVPDIDVEEPLET
jgi:chromosome segregation ATPase